MNPDNVDAGRSSDPQLTSDMPADSQNEPTKELANAQGVGRAPGRPPSTTPGTLSTNDAASRSTFPDLGRFELLEMVGSGGFGTVYKARDPQLGRVVAIKIPRSGRLTSPQDLDRFLREARSVAQLSHPGIVPIHEVGEHQGLPYLVSEFVQGTTLADALTLRRSAPNECARLLAAVADALHYAHEHGVVHRDVKPSNILLDEAGEPHLMDFGLARREAIDITMTVEGQVLGTPAYMSPEQARGEAHQVDRRADIYCLGVVLYQLLAGELPFRGSTRALLNQVMNEEPKPPRSLNDDIPRDLETICLKAMAKEPNRRYQTAAALAADLRCYLDGKPIAARPVGQVERIWRWCKRNPLVATLTALVALTLVVGAAVASYFAFQAEQEATRANRKADDARVEAARADREAHAAKELLTRAEWLYAGRISAAQREWEAGHVKTAWEHLDACRWDFRGWEHAYLHTLFTQNQRTFPGHSSVLAFSPDGKFIANYRKVWEVDTGREVLSFQDSSAMHTGVAFSSDGKQLVTGGMDRTVKVWDLGKKKVIQSLKGHTAVPTCVALSRDGKRIVSGSRDHTVKVWDAAKGSEIHTLEAHNDMVMSVGVSPDGQRIISSGAGSTTVKVWDANQGQLLFTLKGYSGGVFSPDGKRIACADPTTANILRISDADKGQELLALKSSVIPAPGIFSVLWPAAFSPDGARIVCPGEGSTVKVWDVAKGQPILTFKGTSTLSWPWPIARTASASPAPVTTGRSRCGKRIARTCFPCKRMSGSRAWSSVATVSASPIAAQYGT